MRFDYSITRNLNRRLGTASENPIVELVIRQLFHNNRTLDGDFPKPAKLVEQTQRLLELVLR